MKYTIVILLHLPYTACFSQQIDWNQTVNWKLYDLRNEKALGMPLDTVVHFKYIGLNNDTLRSFLGHAEIWPKDKYSVWMGSFTATCDLHGMSRKIDISMYGGFIYDDSTKRYYELPQQLRAEWYGYLNRSSIQLKEK